ncbi:MAG: hypothetical protein ACLPKI_25110 [Streptosporangiaceae bacterium]
MAPDDKARQAVEFRESAQAGDNWWAGALTRKPPGTEPEPEPALDVMALSHADYAAQRAALGMKDQHDVPGSHWSDRRDSQAAAVKAASIHPESEMSKYTRDRLALGITEVDSDIAGADKRQPYRRWVSPWRIA